MAAWQTYVTGTIDCLGDAAHTPSPSTLFTLKMNLKVWFHQNPHGLEAVFSCRNKLVLAFQYLIDNSAPFSSIWLTWNYQQRFSVLSSLQYLAVKDTNLEHFFLFSLLKLPIFVLLPEKQGFLFHYNLPKANHATRLCLESRQRIWSSVGTGDIPNSLQQWERQPLLTQETKCMSWCPYPKKYLPLLEARSPWKILPFPS